MYQVRSLAMSFSTEEDLAARQTLPQAAAEQRRTVTFLSCMPWTSAESTFPVTQTQTDTDSQTDRQTRGAERTFPANTDKCRHGN